MSACVSVWQLNAPLLAVPEGYTKRLDTAFSVQKIVEELHYQYSAEAVRARCSTTRPAAPFVEQRDETGLGRLLRTSSAAVAAVLRAVAMALSSETAPLACGSWRACV